MNRTKGRTRLQRCAMTTVRDEVVLAIDVGGTKIAAGVVTGTTLLVNRRTSTPNTDQPEDVFAALIAVTDEILMSTDPPTAIGIGCGGPMQWPQGRVSPLNIRSWREFPLKERLEEHYGLPARIHNDAICLALAEHHVGAGMGHVNMLGMVISTGVGGGLILNGQVMNGQTGNAGHVGHVVVEPNGAACTCGGRGCLEAEARGPVLSAKAKARGWSGDSTVDLARDAMAGDTIAQEVLAQAGQHIGRALASMVATLDITAVVIGGGVANCGPHLWDSIHETYRAHAGLPWCRDTLITKATAQPEPGLLGAAFLWRP
jgi:glucokinase